MTVLLSAEGTIVLEGSCPSDDAEILLRHLASTPGAMVDLRRCATAHAAVVQVLMAAKPPLQGPPPPGAELWRWIYRMLA